MDAFILAAGFGSRLRPLTNDCPKALIKVRGKALIDYRIEALVRAGFTRVIINVSHHAQKIKRHLGDGGDRGIEIIYSDEVEPLETAGGIINALSIIQSEQFLLINTDIYCDYPLSTLRSYRVSLIHLLLVRSSKRGRKPDFLLNANIVVSDSGSTGIPALYSGIGIFHRSVFMGRPEGRLRLKTILDEMVVSEMVTGELLTQSWLDLGTLSNLKAFAENAE